MKKTLLTVGAITAVVSPIAAVVSCGEEKQDNSVSLLSEKLKFGIRQISTKTKAQLQTDLGTKTTATAAELGIDMSAIELSSSVDVKFTFEKYAGVDEFKIDFVITKGDEAVKNNTGSFRLLTHRNSTVVTSLADESAKLTAKISSKNEAALATSLAGKTTVTLADLGYTLDSAFSAGVTATYKIAPYSGKGRITVTATLAKQNTPNVTNNVWTFEVTPDGLAAPVITDLMDEKIKFGDKTSTKNEDELKADIGSKTTVTAADLGFTPPATLSSAVTVVYTIPAYTGGDITVSFTLTQGTNQVFNNTGTFVVRAKPKAAPTIDPSIKAAVDAALLSVTSTLDAKHISDSNGVTGDLDATTQLGIPQTVRDAVAAAILPDPTVTIAYSKNTDWTAVDKTFTVAYTLTKPGAGNKGGTFHITPAAPVIPASVKTDLDALFAKGVYSKNGAFKFDAITANQMTGQDLGLDTTTNQEINKILATSGHAATVIKYTKHGTWTAHQATYEVDYSIDLPGAVSLTGTLTMTPAIDLGTDKALLDQVPQTSTLTGTQISLLVQASNVDGHPTTDDLTAASLGITLPPLSDGKLSLKLSGSATYSGVGDLNVSFLIERQGAEHVYNNGGSFRVTPA